jgi:predicted alpha/beta-hydrolase family hydrolase
MKIPKRIAGGKRSATAETPSRLSGGAQRSDAASAPPDRYALGVMDLLLDGPEDARDRIVLAHGAGAPMDHPFMSAVAAGLAARAMRVARFEFRYMAARRSGARKPPDRAPVLLDTWREAIAALGGAHNLVLAGKSLGGRIASMVADEVGARGLVCLGYPFHPPGKPDRLRTAHLETLRTPTLIVQGTRDAFGTPEDVGGYALSPAIQIAWIEDGDHSLVPRKSSGRTREDALEEAVARVADFVAAL